MSVASQSNITITCARVNSSWPEAGFRVDVAGVVGKCVYVAPTTVSIRPSAVTVRAFPPPSQCAYARKLNFTYYVSSSGSGVATVYGYTSAAGVQCNATSQQGKYSVCMIQPAALMAAGMSGLKLQALQRLKFKIT